MESITSTHSLPDITINDRDNAIIMASLNAIEQDERVGACQLLVRELARARTVSAAAAPRNVVRLGTHLLYRIHELGLTSAGTLTRPDESKYGEMSISVFSMLGAALLGLAEGQSIQFRPLGDGRSQTASVLKILAQPRDAAAMGDP